MIRGMSIASWILLFWLVIQFLGRAYRATKDANSPSAFVGSGIGVAGWLAAMIYLIHLSGGWK